MDPTISKGSIFTCNGSPDNVVSNNHKRTIAKELAIAKQWEARYGKNLAAVPGGAKSAARQAREWLEAEDAAAASGTASPLAASMSGSQQQQQLQQRPHMTPSRTLLPVSMRGHAGQLEAEEEKAKGFGLSRRDLLNFHRDTNQQGAMQTSSRNIGSRAADRSNAVLSAERLAATSYGRKRGFLAAMGK